MAAAILALSLSAARTMSAEIAWPDADPAAPISVSADRASYWREGSYEVWLLRGRCAVYQGSVRAAGREAVVWMQRGESLANRPHKVIVYFEGDVTVDYDIGQPGMSGAPARVADQRWLGRFYSETLVQLNVPVPDPQPAALPPIHRRALAARRAELDGQVRPAQFVAPGTLGPPSVTLPDEAAGPPTRRIRAFPRSSTPVQARWFPSADGGEWVAVIDSGVNIIVDGLDTLGRVDIATDRLVIWTSAGSQPDLSGQSVQRSNAPLELYMEGNIVFRQGDRVIYAKSMYYNVAYEFGVVLGAEVLTPVADYQGLLRLKADVLRQLNRGQFEAHGAAATSSRLGVPRYWFQSNVVTFQDNQRPFVNPFTGQAEIDPATGEMAVEHDLLATSRGNSLFLGGVPVFYWPVLATDLTKPTYFIDSVKIKSDNIFGVQILTEFDMYQLMGWRNPPEGTRSIGSLDILTDRGLAMGSRFDYERSDLFGIPGPYRGVFDSWFIFDDGPDDLGADRRAIDPDKEYRGRTVWQHRHDLPNGFQFTGELGFITDRNFLEQFFENEWDEQKDLTTGLELKQFIENSSWSITADFRVNGFFTQTQWLPRVDHFSLGRGPVLGRATWFEHSHIGYADLLVGSPPTDPVDVAKFNPLPWEAEREGLRAATRQEIDLPVELGPAKFVPYALGEVAYWGEDLAGDDVTRFYGQLGVRASLPLWRADPAAHSTLLNVRGLAHKVVFEGEFLYADASENLGRFPLYDPLDDDATEHFRRRIPDETFGGLPFPFLETVPLKFDDRFYALRTGLQSWVTSPSTEVVDDLMLVRLGVQQRWQTKRGPPGSERIIDWISLDVQGVIFPEGDRDNFGEELGLLEYDFQWHVGDRLTLVSDGFTDVFSQGLRKFTVGGIVSRPEVGSLYLGFRSIEGPITSNVLLAAVGYRMSDKWIALFGSTVDFGPTGNIGQSADVVRIGESFLVRVGVNVDESRDSFGVHFAIEPRFLSSSRLGRVGGVQIAPAGAIGLE
jgi:hypothetical protein